MKKILKIALWTFISLAILLVGAMSLFLYKVKYGFPVSYETDVPSIVFDKSKPAVLLFSKTTGFRHAGSIEASKKSFDILAKKNNWFVYQTEEGGVFNTEQLKQFSVVIFDNSTGEVINDEQKLALEKYVENGGTLIGIHGAGDNSHHWDWYKNNLLGAEFSHHSLDPHLQTSEVIKDSFSDSLLTNSLANKFSHTDEWYVFFENPRKKGFNIIYTIDGTSIQPSGNMLWMKDKGFGMGKDHPVAWCKTIGKGKTFYTSLGHDESAWANENFVKLVENAVNWGVKKD